MTTGDRDAFVEKLRQGDDVSWRQFIESYKDKVFKTALSFVPFEGDAEDIAQEVFIEVYRSISRFRGNSSLSTWIYRITVNKSINYLKKNRKYLNARPIDDYIAVEKESGSESQDASTSVQQKEHRKIIMHAIQKLPERQATVFVMQKINGQSYKEISELLDVSISSVESLMHRARISLQEKLISLYKQYQK